MVNSQNMKHSATAYEAHSQVQLAQYQVHIELQGVSRFWYAHDEVHYQILSQSTLADEHYSQTSSTVPVASVTSDAETDRYVVFCLSYYHISYH